MLCTVALGRQSVVSDFQTLPLSNGSFFPMTTAYVDGVPHQASVYHSSKNWTVQKYHGDPTKLVGVRIMYAITPTTFFGGENLTSSTLPYLYGTTGVAEYWSLEPWNKHTMLASETGYWSDRGRWVQHSDAPGGNPDMLVFDGFGTNPTYRHSYYVGASNVAPFDGVLDYHGPSSYAGHAGAPSFLIELPVTAAQRSKFIGDGTMNLSYCPRGWIELYAWDVPIHFYQESYSPVMAWQSAPSITAALIFDHLQ